MCVGSCEQPTTIIVFKFSDDISYATPSNYKCNPKYNTVYVNPLCYKCDPTYIEPMIHKVKHDSYDEVHNAILQFVQPVPNKHMKLILLMLSKSLTENQWIDRFKECYKMIENSMEQDKVHYMFTLEQMTQIGQIFHKFPLSDKNSYMKNALVCLCMFPWELSQDIFSYGVCYFGKMGEIPNTIEDACEHIKYNIDHWNKWKFNLHPL